MCSVDLMKSFLGDFDNINVCKEILDEDTSPQVLWNPLICEATIWGEFYKLWYDGDKIITFLRQLCKEDADRYFRFAIECLIAFVQANFTGPKLQEDIEDVLFLYSGDEKSIRDALSMDGEQISPNTIHPTAFFVGIHIIKFSSQISYKIISLWWQLRAIMIHQHILEDLSQELYMQAQNLCKNLSSLPIDRRWQALLEIEQAQLFNLFKDTMLARKHLEKASERLAFTYHLAVNSTRHQIENVAQLCLEVTLHADEGVERPVVTYHGFPKCVPMDDEVRHGMGTAIPDFEQKFLLASLQYMIVSNIQDDLHMEDIKPFFDELVKHKNTWALRTQFLTLRSYFESKDKYTVERAYNQSKEIISAFDESSPPAVCRVDGVYACNLPPLWKTKGLLAEVMLNFGATKESLDICLSLNLWYQVIKFYDVLRMHDKAIEVIRKQLEVAPTVELWCLLGDAADDVSCYKTAWELSDHNSSRVQRHWGDYYFKRKEFEHCVKHFSASLEINSLQLTVWRKYGFAVLQLKRWQAAALAYKNYTVLAPKDHKGWNNLWKAYMQLGNKVAAQYALAQSLKLHYDDWKIWYKFTAFSIAIGKYSDALCGYKRIMELHPTYLNVDVLDALVYGIRIGITNIEGPRKQALRANADLFRNSYCYCSYCTITFGSVYYVFTI